MDACKLDHVFLTHVAGPAATVLVAGPDPEHRSTKAADCQPAGVLYIWRQGRALSARRAQGPNPDHERAGVKNGEDFKLFGAAERSRPTAPPARSTCRCCQSARGSCVLTGQIVGEPVGVVLIGKSAHLHEVGPVNVAVAAHLRDAAKALYAHALRAGATIMLSWVAAAPAASMTRSPTKGPRSLTRTIMLRPLLSG